MAAGGVPFLFYPVMGLIMLGIFAVTPSKEGNYSSYTAYHYVHTGEAYNYHQEYLKRVDTIKNGGREVVVEPYYFRPWIISVGDLWEDPTYEANAAMAHWYDKEAISCRMWNSFHISHDSASLTRRIKQREFGNFEEKLKQQ